MTNYPYNTANFFCDDVLSNGCNDGFAATGSTLFVDVLYTTNVGGKLLAIKQRGCLSIGLQPGTKIGKQPAISRQPKSYIPTEADTAFARPSVLPRLTKNSMSS